MQVFDASSMIYARDNYPVRQFPPLWKWMAIQIKEKKLVMPSVAFKEGADKAPDCGKWLKENNLEQLETSNAIIQDAIRIKGLLGIVNDNYHPKGVGENDIIIATTIVYKAELISDEERQPTLPREPGKKKIPAVCSIKDVAVLCISFIEYIRRSDEIFQLEHHAVGYLLHRDPSIHRGAASRTGKNSASRLLSNRTTGVTALLLSPLASSDQTNDAVQADQSWRRCLTALFLCLMTVLTGTPVFSDEPVSVSDIVADPDVYHLKQVTIQGVVGRVKELQPYYLPSGSACYGAYAFLLEDDSANGSVIDVAVLGICGAPRVRFPEVADGDRIRVQAEIQVPSRFGQSRALDGTWIAKGPEPAVQAIAKSISRVEE